MRKLLTPHVRAIGRPAGPAFPGTPQYWRSLDPAAAASALGGPLLAVVSET